MRAAVVACLVACNQSAAPPAPASIVAAKLAPASEATAQFWSWFTVNASRLASGDLEKAMVEINDHLEPTHRGIFVEIGAGEHVRTLVITADGNRDYFPLVQKVFDVRPASIPGWKIVAFRQRDAAPFTIELGGLKLDPKDLRFVAGAGASGKIDLDVFVASYTDTPELKQALYIVLDHTLGEFDMETKIGGIDFHALSEAGSSARPLLELPRVLDAVVTTPPR
jgi:hypothetical protein